jgi:hypothetical protein
VPPAKPASPQLLDRAASAQARVEQARQAAELSARHHLDLAAATFEVLRRVFGDKGACAMPQEQVCAGVGPGDGHLARRFVWAVTWPTL